MALPRNVTGHPRRDRADRRPARPPRPPANRRHGDPGPTHRRGEPRRAPAAPRAARRDRPARRDAQRHARSARAGLRDPTSLHRRRLARAPLTLSRLRAELEVTLRRPRPAGEYEETLRSCLDEVQRVQSLIEELLGLARIDARQEPEPAKPIPVSEIVEAAVAAVRPEAEQRGVTVAVERPAELLVNAAPGAAKVALANILDNAVKFSPTGGQVRIVVTAGREDVVIAVSDTGPGVSPQEVARLFERFYRGKASRSMDVPGFGLGLAVSQALVERQGRGN